MAWYDPSDALSFFCLPHLYLAVWADCCEEVVAVWPPPFFKNYLLYLVLSLPML
ncbi:MAG: hypothetical protein ABWK05_03625 [Pyrobaculum sp.]